MQRLAAIIAAAVWTASGLFGQTAPNQRPGQLFAIVIGIDLYSAGSGIDPVPGAETDAAGFQSYLATQREIPLTPRNLILLNGPNATLARIRDAVKQVLQLAGPNDSIYLFMSARGITEQLTHRGFLLLQPSTAGNYQGTQAPPQIGHICRVRLGKRDSAPGGQDVR